MKKWILAFLLLTLLGVAAVAAWRYLLPERHVSDLYRRYHNADGIAASYIHNFPVNDTLTLDVTLLEATTDSAWNGLVKEFNFGDQFNAELPSDTNAVSFWFAPRNHYNLPMDSTLLNNDIVVASQYRKTMAVFHITSEDQVNAIVFRQIVNVKPQNQHPSFSRKIFFQQLQQFAHFPRL